MFTTILDPNREVGEFAATVPNAVKVFETYGIDYCCHGSDSLAKACKKLGVHLSEVCQALEKNSVIKVEGFIDWDKKKLSELISYIVSKHHSFTKTELDRLINLLNKVCSVHENNHPELNKVKTLFYLLFQDLTTHLMKEEQVLFPYIIRLETAVDQKEPLPYSHFGSVNNPIQMMMYEHDQASSLLKELHSVTNSYISPDDACASYKALYAGIKDLELDLHQHIHLESNILFPRAVELEKAFAQKL